MEPIDLSYDKALTLLQGVVAKAGGDFIYRRRRVEETYSCLYVHDGEPDCGVGRALHEAGVPLDRLRAADEDSLSAFTLLMQLEDEGVLTCDPLASVLLDHFQSEQDGGMSWGMALQRAINQANSTART